MLVEIADQGGHGLVEDLAVGHSLKTGHWLVHEAAHIGAVFLHRKALEGFRCYLGRGFGIVRLLLTVQKGSLEGLQIFPVLCRDLVAVEGIIMQDAEHQQTLVKIGREQLSDQRSVHIKQSDPFLRLQVVL